MIRLVIAEDQTLVLGAIAALLELEDDLTIIGRAKDGTAALDLVRTLVPDILLTDIEMPGPSGIDVARDIAAASLPTRTIIVTTFARPGYLARARTAGVRGYLLKDAPVEQLAAAIRTVATGGTFIPPDLMAAAWDAGADPLTARERDALRLAEEGLSNKDIARRLGLSPGTVRNYLSTAAGKLNAANRIEAGRIARANGWL
ncbi:two component transcriptional regulator, LuxR family [Gluconacetobacter diazotrophicus PA1 5]|uniref:Response regulator transcription factor n=2 Tax=Gluconacetobacter diazotrophicus TaxID=33996 RepID=A0A7W4I5C1_GLUDI|nr:response regulator transcription factor [Gluconacetobacter diazotrophicus]ACI51668.1 two component transcriptional regulator, LuxR family [Gluconacetobacter diazotrophicus PA1 5]MBB2155300.1 response regulator transcription factor [Gluconacetobacter diazotrophicus]TWB11012.1 LuxR family two component transcriptional regulator [Gluconacetobacter diazotrophicus]CAP55138.1 putative two-component system regulatory protein [Gluconacetobacter diazotrophicus PA1 5]